MNGGASESDSCLDVSRLEKVRQTGGKITARCPACAEGGGDRRGNHLVIFPSGGFACAAMSGDAEHRRRIFALTGIAGERSRSPEDARLWKQRRAVERRREDEERKLMVEARGQRKAIIARHPWLPPDVWDDSPQRIDCDLVERDPRHFLGTHFPADATLWTGEVFESGEGHAHRWRTCAEWQGAPDTERIGPMITPSIWAPGESSRRRENMLTAPYVVLDFDGLDGRKPETPEEMEQHVLVSLALIRWVREGLRWTLAAIVWTGGKSLHAWFHTPSKEVLATLRPVAAVLGMDAGLIGNAEHPCRLPGQRHEKTGRASGVVWLRVGE